MKSIFLIFSIVLTSFCGFPAQADDLNKLSRKVFNLMESELAKIEDSDGAKAASAEIQVAKKLIEDGKRYLAEGSLKKAAVIAERLPTQLELVRALVAAGIVVLRAEEMEKKIHAHSNELTALKARLARLMLMYHGEAATHAFPGKKETAE